MNALNQRFWNKIFLIFVGVSVFGCLSTGNIVKSSHSTGSETSYNNIMVMATNSTPWANHSLENLITGTLTMEGTKAKQAYEFIQPSSLEKPKEQCSIKQPIQTKGVNAVLTIDLKVDSSNSKQWEDQVQDPVSKFHYYSTFLNYYSVKNTSPISADTEYYIYATLYDASTQKPIFNAVSEKFEKMNWKKASRNFAFNLVESLKNKNLISEYEVECGTVSIQSEL